MSISDPRPTKNVKREAARQAAQEARAREQRAKKRRRLLVQIGVVAGIAAVLAGVWGVWSAANVPPGPGPASMSTGGVIFNAPDEVQASDAQPAESKTRDEPVFDGEKVSVTLYADYMCPGCGNFEQLYGGLLESLLESGHIQLHMVPVTFLDMQSAGTKYSSRAANLVGCLVEQQPEYAYGTHTRLFDAGTQPAEGSAGLTDRQLLAIAKEAGAEMTGELQSCVQKRSFADFFQVSSDIFSTTGAVGLAEGERLQMPGLTGELQPEGEPQKLASTPTVIVDGGQWQRAEDFALFLEKHIAAKSEQPQ